MTTTETTAAAFAQQLNGNFVGMLDWPQLDALWLRVRSAPEGWYASQSGEAVPQTALSADALNRFIDEVDALLRREHKQTFCGIVYADNREQPGFIKIYDPHNMGSFCSCSSTPVQPLWVLSRSKPTRLAPDTALPGPRAVWWHRLFASSEN